MTIGQLKCGDPTVGNLRVYNYCSYKYNARDILSGGIVNYEVVPRDLR